MKIRIDKGLIMFVILFAMLTALKTSGTIKMSWWVVTAPLWFWIVILATINQIVSVFDKLKKEFQKK
jgi:hypothetical protein